MTRGARQTVPAYLVQGGLALIAATPLVMVLSRGIAPVLLLVSAGLLASASALLRRAEAVGALQRSALMAPTVVVAFALLAFMTLSLAWSPAGWERAGTVAAMLGVLLVAIVLLTNLIDLRTRPPVVPIALIVMAAALAIVVEVLAGSPIRSFLGLEVEAFELNRASIAVVLFAPAVTGMLMQAGRGLLVVPLWATVAAAAFLSESQSAQLGCLVVGLLCLVAPWAPRRMHRLATVLMIIAVLAMPAITLHAGTLIPALVDHALPYQVLGIRVDIWREYASLVPLHPLAGFGLDASRVIVDTPVAAGLTDHQRAMLDFPHPHNAALQLWFELGAIGVGLALVLMVLGLRAMEKLPPALLPPATATACGVFVIANISHGAWQAWWWALLALVVALFVLARTASRAGGPG